MKTNGSEMIWCRECGNNRDIKAVDTAVQTLFGDTVVNWRGDRLWNAVYRVDCHKVELLDGHYCIGIGSIATRSAEVLWKISQSQIWVPLGIEMLHKLICTPSIIPVVWRVSRYGRGRIFFDGTTLEIGQSKKMVSPYMEWEDGVWKPGLLPLAELRDLRDSVAVIRSTLFNRLLSALFPE